MAKRFGPIYVKKTNLKSKIFSFGKPEKKREEDILDGISRFGGNMREPSYSYSYLESARVLLDNAIVNNQLDEFGLPIFYLVRHTMELKIKELLSVTYSILQMNYDLNKNETTKEKLPSKGSLDRLESDHNICKLYNDLLCSCEKLEVKVPTLLFSSLIAVLNRYEVNPTWSRYHKSNKGNHVSCEIALPIVKIVEDLECIFVAVSYDNDNINETMESVLHWEINSLMSRVEDAESL